MSNEYEEKDKLKQLDQTKENGMDNTVDISLANENQETKDEIELEVKRNSVTKQDEAPEMHKYFDEKVEMTFFTGLVDILQLFFFGSLWFLQSNMQQSILIGFLNSKYNDPTLITALGSGMTQMSIVFYGFLYGFLTTYTVLGSNAYGGKKHYLFGTQLNRCRFLGFAITLGLTIIYLPCNQFVGKLLKLTPLEQSNTFTYLWMRLISIYFEYEFFFMVTYLQIIGKSLTGVITLVLGSLLFPLYCVFFIYLANLGIYGAGLVIISFNVSMTIIFWVVIHIIGRRNDHLHFFNLDTFSDMWTLIKIATPLFLFNMLDNLGYEIMAIFANYQPKAEYNAYIIVSSVLNIMATVANSFLVVTNISVSSLMGRGLYERAKQFSLYIFISANIIGLIVYIPVICLKVPILGLLVTDPEISKIANQIYFYMLFCIYIEINISIFNGNLISTGKFYVALILYIVYTGINVLSIYIFIKVLQVGVKGVYIGCAVAKLVMIIIHSFIYVFFIKWKEASEEIVKEVEKGMREIKDGESEEKVD